MTALIPSMKSGSITTDRRLNRSHSKSELHPHSRRLSREDFDRSKCKPADLMFDERVRPPGPKQSRHEILAIDQQMH